MKVRRNILSGKTYLCIVAFILLGFSSCKTARVIQKTTVIVKPITTNKLIRNAQANAFDYNHLSIKKISCQFDNGKSKTSFRASIQADQDKQIVLNLTKLNIPVGRLWLTPDSVKFINFLEDSYLLDDYSYLSSMLDMDINFQTVNSIISNNVFLQKDDKRDYREYETSIDSGMYVLQSVKSLKTIKTNPKGPASRKTARRARKLVDGAPVRQRIYIDPETFKLRKIKMDDAVNGRTADIEFSEFVKVGEQLYPGEIYLHFLSAENNMSMRIKLSNFSMDQEKSIRFKVPEKYTRISHE